MAGKQLDLVARLARERESAAAQALGQAQAQLADIEAQQRQILAYQAEYQNMARGARGGALTARNLVDARKFLDEINAIVATQQDRVNAAEAQVVRQQQAWAEAARYTRAIEKLAAERAASAALAEDKRLQQQIDDFYGQQSFFKR